MTLAGFFPETEMPDAGWWRVLWPDPAATLRALGVTPGLAAVDLCCGDGTFTAALARLTGRTVHAIDIDPACLDRARAAVRRDGGGDCAFVLGDAMVVDRLLPGPVDYVLLANALHGVPDQPRLAPRDRDGAAAGWAACGGQLARAPAGADHCAGRAARSGNRNADSAGSVGRAARTGGIPGGGHRGTAALSLRGGVRAWVRLNTSLREKTSSPSIRPSRRLTREHDVGEEELGPPCASAAAS